MKKLVFFWLIFGLIFSLKEMGYLAFFSDTEVSSGNVFQAGAWNPHPRLSLNPDDGEVTTTENQISYSIWVRNEGDEPKDEAKNVELGITAVKGQDYLEELIYDPILGNIPAGGEKGFSFLVKLKETWLGADQGSEVKLRIEVTREDNWPEHNVGKKIHFTIIKD